MVSTVHSRVLLALAAEFDAAAQLPIDASGATSAAEAGGPAEIVVEDADVRKVWAALTRRAEAEADGADTKSEPAALPAFGTTRVMAAGLDQEIRLSLHSILSSVVPVAKAALKLQAALSEQAGATKRILVALAGGAGSGKTIMAQLLQRTLNTLAGAEVAVAISGDGYHRCQSYLESTLVANATGDMIPLVSVKGRPATMDAAAMVRDLQVLRAGTDEVGIPEYDRLRHDAVPNAIRVLPSHLIVIVEGLYVLAGGAEDAFPPTAEPSGATSHVLADLDAQPNEHWRTIRALFDLSIFLDVPVALSRQRLIDRKASTGKDPAAAAAQYDRADAVTLRELQPCMMRADVVFRVEPSGPVAATVRQRVDPGREQTALQATFATTGLCSLPEGTCGLSIGLRPALQKTLVFNSWERDKVNRAQRALTGVGGKGQTAAKAMSRITDSDVYVAQFLEGVTGDIITQLLDGWRIKQLTTNAGGIVRTCITLLDSKRGDMTELVEPSAGVTAAEADALFAQVSALNSVGIVTIMGTYPTGCESFYAKVVSRFGHSAKVLVDGVNGVVPCLETNLVFAYKVNATELCALVSVELPDPSDTFGRRRAITRAARALASRYMVTWIGVTDGPSCAYLFPGGTPHQWYEYEIPSLGDKFANPIGAGDTVAGVTMITHAAGLPVPAAFAWGLACGSASCMDLQAAVWDMHHVVAIFNSLKVRQVVWSHASFE